MTSPPTSTARSSFAPAIALYEKLGFERVPVYAVKRKNPINERLFAGAPPDRLGELNPMPGSWPTRRCAAGSRSKCSTPRAASSA